MKVAAIPHMDLLSSSGLLGTRLGLLATLAMVFDMLSRGLVSFVLVTM